MKPRYVAVTTALVLVALLGGFGLGEQYGERATRASLDPVQVAPAERPAPSASVDTAKEAREVTQDKAALAFESADVGAVTCKFGGPIEDLAWFDVTWRTETDVDGFTVELVDADGITKVGPALTVPPVNVGGQIALGGTSTWEGRRDVLGGSGLIFYGDVSDTELRYAPAGETGLLVLHLRFDPEVTATREGAVLPALRATYYDTDGDRQQVDLEVDQRWTSGGC